MITIKCDSPSRILGLAIGNNRFRLVEETTSPALELCFLNNVIAKAARVANHSESMFGKTSLPLVDPDPSR